MTDTRFVPVATEGEIGERQFTCCVAEGVALVICRFRDEYFAIENTCSHAQSTFDEGRMRGYRIMCPLHGGTFDIRDGSAVGAPATRPVRSFPVRVREGKIEVGLN